MAVVVVGVSHIPGIGYSVAQRFAMEGMKVALIGRHEEELVAAKNAILEQVPTAEVLFAQADATNRHDMTYAFAAFKVEHGPPTALVYNMACQPSQTKVADLDEERLVADFTTTVQAALISTQCVLPMMRELQAGTIIFTGAGASLRGTANFGSYCAAKGALRALAQSLAHELNPEGIHVAHVVVDGMVDMPHLRQQMPDLTDGRLLDPDAIAELYWHLHSQPPRCFTFEVDARPCEARW